MLARITSGLFQEWRAYEELEPFGEERGDFRSAQIVQALCNIARDTKRNPNGWPINEFMLRLGDSPWAAYKAVQPLAYQEMLIDTWIAGSNATFAAVKKD